MRILLICPFFPPENKIASVRIAKFAEHWAKAGHDVRVLTRTATGMDLAVPEHDNLQVFRVADPMNKSLSAAQKLKPTRSNLVTRLLGVAYSRALSLVWPDVYGRWAKRAQQEASNWNAWTPDVVVASVGPFSTLLLGAKLADHFNSKLAVDYRDLLTLSTYYQHGPIRRAIDGRIERKAAQKAAVLATVSKPLADDLRGEYQTPAIVVTNGYDPADFDEFKYAPDSDTLRITYCGWVIPHRRDPRPFLEGVALLRDRNPRMRVVVDFYGPPSAEVLKAVEDLGLEDSVFLHGKVSHQESLRIQANSDVLLLLLWNDPGEAGVLSGKVFEYIGAKRPILMTGLEDGAAGALIRDNNLGFVGNDPNEISVYLERLAEEKKRTGRVIGPELPNPQAFTRDFQSQTFLDALENL